MGRRLHPPERIGPYRPGWTGQTGSHVERADWFFDEGLPDGTIRFERLALDETLR